jgi:hypothetical protein
MDSQSQTVVDHCRVGSSETTLGRADAHQRLAFTPPIPKFTPEAQHPSVIEESGVWTAEIIVGNADIIQHIGDPAWFTELPVEIGCLLPALQRSFQTLEGARCVLRTCLLR